MKALFLATLRGIGLCALGLAVLLKLVPLLWGHQSSFAAELAVVCIFVGLYLIVYGAAVLTVVAQGAKR